ncbi:putative notch (DSL) domain-containing protein [Neospora caninum Liverpool]|uniref:Notch (DSL) domain-containing protein, putative n=1 Tax=Neospora caninum (strain Liverpool) TaxID=572307 RepID=F0VCI5_NEOCL|nr:putative notch (DSL) domain-containing protein [Neospora caninum Liverpool]CBZ51674.1 putative notch (DSL) domain-containing protein [Neospora caninum Liverpool]CEL65628.1 TPA: notch (DSL) domain-containing protein, putative [Neospora caninum Liverpool]|eukprot:XP_003881707.1 putative notch (DSL) domain-containing protein [Neospora caninum Liverpool]
MALNSVFLVPVLLLAFLCCLIQGRVVVGAPAAHDALLKPAARFSDPATLTAAARAAQTAADTDTEDAVGLLGTPPSSPSSAVASSPTATENGSDESRQPSSAASGTESSQAAKEENPAESTSAAPEPSQPSGVLERDVSQWHASRKGEDLVYPSNRHGGFPEAPFYPPHDHLREHYPTCPAECLEDWVGDGWCDSECNVAECGYDGPDCQGWCGGECRPGWPGDGQCDLECYKEECDWDGGDCKDWYDRNLPSVQTLQQKLDEVTGNSEDPDQSVSKLLKQELGLAACECVKGKLGNGVCNPECNTYECQFDGFDCRQMCSLECPHVWLGDGKCDKECDIPECYHDKGDCDTCSGSCRTWMIGNGICDPDCNNKDCGYDNGDCNGITWVTAVDYDAKPYVYQFCAREFIGDGNCDENCYNAESEWDGGDCRGTALAKRLAADGVGPQFPAKKDKNQAGETGDEKGADDIKKNTAKQNGEGADDRAGQGPEDKPAERTEEKKSEDQQQTRRLLKKPSSV